MAEKQVNHTSSYDLYKAVKMIRVELQNSDMKKSGKNSHAGFSYFELSDFLPTLNNLYDKYGVTEVLTIKDDTMTLKLIKDEKELVFEIPFNQYETPTSKSGAKMMQDVQYYGAMITYHKRYLYLNAFGITDGEVIDTMNNEELAQVKQEQTALKEVQTKLAKLCKEKGLNLKEVAQQCGLNADSKVGDFEKVIMKLQNKKRETNEPSVTVVGDDIYVG